jgi:hypothetical protein
MPPFRDEDLRAIDHVVIAIEDGARTQAAQIRPRRRLRHADCTDQLAARELGQQPQLLLFGAVVQ